MTIRAAVSLTLLATLSAMLTVPIRSNAEWVQNPIGVPRAPGCDPGYSWQKMGVRYQCVTPQPTCANGFASGPAWNGATWIYSCNPPPAPTCQYGYASGPTWNGSAWLYQCNQPITPPPQTPPPPSDPEAICRAYTTQQLGSFPGWASSFVSAGQTTFMTNMYSPSYGDNAYAWCEVDNTSGNITSYGVQGQGTDMGG